MWVLLGIYLAGVGIVIFVVVCGTINYVIDRDICVARFVIMLIKYGLIWPIVLAVGAVKVIRDMYKDVKQYG